MHQDVRASDAERDAARAKIYDLETDAGLATARADNKAIADQCAEKSGDVLGHIDTIPVIGVPSASALRWHNRDAAAYNIYRVAKADGVWKLAIEIRGLTNSEDRFAATGSYELAIPLLRH